MECASCGAEIRDEQAKFCSRCGAALAPLEGEPTAPLDGGEGEHRRADDDVEGRIGAGDAVAAAPPEGDAEPAPGGGTRQIEVPGTPTAGWPEQDLVPLARDFVASIRSYLVTGGWVRAGEGAAIAFLALLALGAVFVLLAKLLDADFGAGENPLWMLTRIVLAGLGAIGVAIERGGEGAAALPLGVLAVFGWLFASTARRVTERSPAATSLERAVEGAKIAVPFALLCFVAALAFRIRAGGDDLAADPGAALFVPLVWGSLFGAVGGLLSVESSRDLVRAAGDRLQSLSGGMRDGVWAASLMLAATLLLALAAVLVFLVAAVIAAPSLPLTVAEAVVFLVVLAAFLPNAVSGAAAFALGAPLEFFARTLDGAELARRASLLVGGESAPGYAYLLLAIPLVACLLGGYAARRRAQDRRPQVVLGTAAAAYALLLSTLVLLAGVRVSQAFIGTGNYLVVAGDAVATLLLAGLWAGVLGFAGWRLASQGAGQRPPGAASDAAPAIARDRDEGGDREREI